MNLRAWLLLLPLGLGGCYYISPGDEDERNASIDADEDGVPAKDDCDDGDPDVTGTTPWYADGDQDGFGAGAPIATSCTAPTNTASNATDCDDTRDAVNPSAIEVCNQLDDDCDGGADDLDLQGADDALTQWVDVDEDGYGDDAIPEVTSCVAIADGVLQGGDCDDGDGDVNPAAVEVCDAADTDEDCSGEADDADPEVQGQIDYWVDADEDGYGDDQLIVTTTCEPPIGKVTNDADCDDDAPGTNPAAIETCDAANTDEDCDGDADNADPGEANEKTWYVDGDGDTYGAPTASKACDAPTTNSVERAGDCDDLRADVSPAGVEACDALNADEDCDSAADDLDAAATGKVESWPDADDDTFGDATATGTFSCDPPALTASEHTDCDDDAPTAHPGASEVCGNDLDEDCEGTRCLPPRIDLTTTPPSFVGKNANAGNTDATGGFDFNGDGFGDLAIGSFQDTTNTTNAGAVFVFLGPHPSADLGAPDAIISSRKPSPTFSVDWDYTGTAVARGGDMNGDAHDELVLAGFNGNDRRGLVWVIAGRPSPGATIDTEVDSRLELTSSGPLYTDLGTSIVGGGFDLTGDGNADFVVGSRGGAGFEDSRLWVVDGTLTGKHAIEEPSLAVTRIRSSSPVDLIGVSSSTGDLDGDGVGDLAVGGFHYNAGAGRVWVVLGPITTPGDLLLGATSNTTADFVLNNATGINDRFGKQTAMVDVNGDGLDDLVTASIWDRPDVTPTWIPGVLHVFESPLGLTETNATADHRVIGFSNPNAAQGDALGSRLSNGGDMDADGLGDLIATAPYVEAPLATQPSDGLGHGAVVTLTGDALTSNGTTIRLDDHLTTPFAGITVITAGVASRVFGNSAKCAGDADGDGYDDLIVTEVHKPNGATNAAGATWLLFSDGM